MAYVSQTTLQYVTFIKRGLVEALQDAFNNHPEKVVANAKVALDFTHTRFTLPAVIIRFVERQLPNAGVGHVEYLPAPTDPNPLNPTTFIRYYHRMYRGDVLFEVYGMSSPDRDLVRDALVEVLAMTDVTTGGSAFVNRLYYFLDRVPYDEWNFPVLNLDLISGSGDENAVIAPWAPEDQLVYRSTYSVPIFGEFYSQTPVAPTPAGLVEEIDVYPYVASTDPTPDTNPDPGTTMNPWYQFTGWKSSDTVI
jgi:hypothetical protein